MPRASFEQPLASVLSLEIEGHRAELRPRRFKFFFSSKSDPDTEHEVVFTPGSIDCSCRGFNYNERCWHTEWVKEKISFGLEKEEHGQSPEME